MFPLPTLCRQIELQAFRMDCSNCVVSLSMEAEVEGFEVPWNTLQTQLLAKPSPSPSSNLVSNFDEKNISASSGRHRTGVHWIGWIARHAEPSRGADTCERSQGNDDSYFSGPSISYFQVAGISPPLSSSDPSSTGRCQVELPYVGQSSGVEVE
jgi:hypothetical protein